MHFATAERAVQPRNAFQAGAQLPGAAPPQMYARTPVPARHGIWEHSQQVEVSFDLSLAVRLWLLKVTVNLRMWLIFFSVLFFTPVHVLCVFFSAVKRVLVTEMHSPCSRGHPAGASGAAADVRRGGQHRERLRRSPLGTARSFRTLRFPSQGALTRAGS